jgi:cellulase/cellobiase CelA1
VAGSCVSVAREPKSSWLGRFTRPNFSVKARRLIDAAKAQGAAPLFTVLRAEATSCGPNCQGGGPSADAATRAWYDDLARVIRGPRRDRDGRRITVWCNPGLRGLGPPPTTSSSNPKVDAYLWINRPGFARSCQGRPIAWYPPRALSHARYPTNWESAPAGARFGHLEHRPLSAFGIP